MQDFTPSAVYYTRSSTNPNYFYALTRDAVGHLDCECPDRMYRRNRFCKHVKQVVRGKVMPATLKALSPGPSPFTTPDDLVARAGRVWS